MSKKGDKRIGHILRKYPQLLHVFNIMDDEESNSTSDIGLKRIFRKYIEKSNKKNVLKKKRTSKPKYNQDCNSSQGFNKNSIEDLFNCPVCRKLLETPITIDCGHSFCKGCIDSVCGDKCSVCESEIGTNKNTNIVVQSIVDKLKYDEQNDEASSTKCRDGIEQEFRYCLRSRCSGLHGNCLEDLKAEKSTTLSTHQRKDSIIQQMDLSINNITVSDLECIVCSQCFMSPITTTCGHTFCRECLARVFDHGLACPLCMTSLKISEQFRGETIILTQALQTHLHKKQWERLTNSLSAIDVLNGRNEIPIFICTNAFPKVPCPLYIYEPRYRLLSRRCVQSSTKKFGMASKTTTCDKFSVYGTLLEIKDCVNFQNGTSILTTVGLTRFKVISRGEQDGYDTAVVEYLQDMEIADDKLSAIINLHKKVYNKTICWLQCLKTRLLTEIERCIGRIPSVEKEWYHLQDGPSWTWWLIAVLPLSNQLRVGFLACTNLEKRLFAIDKMLNHMKNRMKAFQKNNVNCCDTEDSFEFCSHAHESDEFQAQSNV